MRSQGLPGRASLLLALGGTGPYHKPVIDPKTIAAPFDVWCEILKKHANELMSALRQLTRSKLAPVVQKRSRDG